MNYNIFGLIFAQNVKVERKSLFDRFLSSALPREYRHVVYRTMDNNSQASGAVEEIVEAIQQFMVGVCRLMKIRMKVLNILQKYAY